MSKKHILSIAIVIAAILISSTIYFNFYQNRPHDSIIGSIKNYIKTAKKERLVQEFLKDEQINSNKTEISTDDSEVKNVVKYNKMAEETDPGSLNITIQYFKTRTDDVSMPSVYQNRVVYNNVPTIRNRKYKTDFISLLDINTMKEDIIYTHDYSEEIDDTLSGKNWIFWVEGVIPTPWKIKAYNLTTKKIITLRDSEKSPYSQDLLARINNDGDTIIWIESYTDSDNHRHFIIYTYDFTNNKVVEIARMNYLKDPYTFLQVKDGYVAFPDIVNEKWVVKVASLSDGTIKEVFCGKKHPKYSCFDGNILIYKEDDDGDFEEENLFLHNFKTGDKILIDNDVNYATICDGNVIYSKDYSEDFRSTKLIYKYITEKNIKVCLTKDELDKGYDYIQWFGCYNNTIVGVADKNLYKKDKNNEYISSERQGVYISIIKVE